MGSHCLNLLSRARAELEQSEESTPTPPVMFRVVLVSCLAAAACGQSLEAKDAKILKEQRFAAGDGRFGSAFAQEDGTVFREETTADGERIGQYSYIDENGETITVRYTAGKDGFRILEGAHIPEGANGLQSAPFDPEIAQGEPQPQQSPPAQPQAAPVREQARPVRPVRRRPVRPAQQRQQQPQFVAQQPQQQQQQPQPPQVPSGDFNPFINPADPSHLDFQTNINAAQFRPRQPAQEIPRQRQQAQPAPVQQFQPAPVQRQQFQPAPVQRQQFQSAPVQRQQSSLPSAASVPACANCAGVNPFISPAGSSPAELFSAQQPAAQPAFRQPASTFLPQQPQQQQQQPNPAFQFQQRSQAQQQPLQPAFATPTSRQPQQTFRQPQQTFRQPQQTQPTTLNEFQGQLSLNRFDTGFNFDFSS